jgi:hypothetical protein
MLHGKKTAKKTLKRLWRMDRKISVLNDTVRHCDALLLRVREVPNDCLVEFRQFISHDRSVLNHNCTGPSRRDDDHLAVDNTMITIPVIKQ